ncbi:putative ABC transport system permease protein [Actinoplanes lutulentus]|uniref:Putative ABC transport system permease protein n=1 Tax=Actinoplanes lutulentus TaxID=1287878 RepID=A0A327Z2G8_9ACTN|nr:ABC transporter permease [Actinoplanes lutulentus]MBB2947472.1 putative ABC transport system permease protein [Actinoplanes lutulentus]RAK28079.1 putative ABC transport system permease protein [Actinoplanes lutulentus]
MMRLSGRFRSSLIIGLQGIRARKLRTLLSMISLFLGVLAVVTVQAGASIAERALMSDVELQSGYDGTVVIDVMPHEKSPSIVSETVAGRNDAVSLIGTSAIIGEPGVSPINPGGAPFDQGAWGSTEICDNVGNCVPGPPTGEAIEVVLTAVAGDLLTFRPLRPVSGDWLAFDTVPSLAPKIVINEEAAKGFRDHQVPAEMRVRGAKANMTPQIVGVVHDGDYQPRAYVRQDELTNWMPTSSLIDPNFGGQITVMTSSGSPVEQVLQSRLRGAGAESYVNVVQNRKEMEKQLMLMRLIFLSMAGLVLLIGVAGILNVGLATVGERVEEFALRRAVGTPRTLLAGIVLAETMLTGLLTAAAAIGAGIAGLKIVSMVLGGSEPLLANVQFPWDAGVAGILAGIIAGVLGGFIPALRAAGIPIATVMRA